MQRYKVTGQLGDGTYGSVFKAVNRQTGEVVAVKKMKRKFHNWDECLALREVRWWGTSREVSVRGDCGLCTEWRLVSCTYNSGRGAQTSAMSTGHPPPCSTQPDATNRRRWRSLTHPAPF